MTEREALTVFRTTQKCRHQALHTNDCGNCERCQYRLEQEQIDGAVDMAISALEKQEQDRWIPCKERLPKCEQEVLICTKEKTYIHEKSGFEWCINPIVTPAIYEDGTMLEVDSKWHWEYCDWAGWDEEEDCGIIPEGWWENRQFNPDGEYNHAIDVEVVAWRPLPEPYTEEES